jgi:glycine hydroxymethyltransferase
MIESDFEHIAELLHEALQIALKLQEQSGPSLKDFVRHLSTNEDVVALRAKVNAFATTFPMPGFDPKEMKYQDPNGPSET